jgi:UDP-glucuronate decarboxylase
LCYVDGLVDALIRLMNTPPEVTGPINPGNPGCELMMLELAAKVLELAGCGGSNEHHPLPSDDPVRRRPNIDQAQRPVAVEPGCVAGRRAIANRRILHRHPAPLTQIHG